jgi:DNA end-binding protein Ku
VPKAKSQSTRSRSVSSAAKSRAKSGKSHASSAPAAEGGRSLRPLWSGTLSFGLVSVPVDLYPATRAARIGLRMLGPDGTPLARRFFCPEHEAELSSDDLVRGYEYKPGKYVQVTDEELAALEPKKSRDIDLQYFVPEDSIDPVYFERSFFLMPSGNSGKAYQLLASVMEKTHRAGVATFVLRDREYLVAIFARDGVLMAEALRFHDEVRDPGALGLRKAKPDAAAVKQYAALIAKHSHDKFDPTTLHNEHNEALRALASKKAKRKQDVVETGAEVEADEEQSGSAETVDLMRMLKKSLKAS